MSTYLNDDLPFPNPRNRDEEQFWANCGKKRLAFRGCTDCGHVQHPPLPICPHCQSLKSEWRDAPGHAQLYTYTVVHHVVHESVKEAAPYIVSVVIFPELGDLRFVSNLVDVPADEIVIGMDLTLIWEPFRDGIFLPRFEKRLLA